jgi:hypothetical protein
MTKAEHELNNHLLEQGWAEGAASVERIGSLLNRRMAQLALAEAEVDDATYDDLQDIAA